MRERLKTAATSKNGTGPTKSIFLSGFIASKTGAARLSSPGPPTTAILAFFKCIFSEVSLLINSINLSIGQILALQLAVGPITNTGLGSFNPKVLSANFSFFKSNQIYGSAGFSNFRVCRISSKRWDLLLTRL